MQSTAWIRLSAALPGEVSHPMQSDQLLLRCWNRPTPNGKYGTGHHIVPLGTPMITSFGRYGSPNILQEANWSKQSDRIAGASFPPVDAIRWSVIQQVYVRFSSPGSSCNVLLWENSQQSINLQSAVRQTFFPIEAFPCFHMEILQGRK